jgi:hypothetical protein
VRSESLCALIKTRSSIERSILSKNWNKQLHTLSVLHFNSCLKLKTVKQQHTSTATSILTTKSTYRSLSAQRLSERTVIYACVGACAGAHTHTQAHVDAYVRTNSNIDPSLIFSWFFSVPSDQREGRTLTYTTTNSVQFIITFVISDFHHGVNEVFACGNVLKHI